MKKYIIHNRKAIIKTLVIGTVAFIAYAVAHKVGTAERGFQSVGGEIFIPFVILFAEEIWGMIKAPFEVG